MSRPIKAPVFRCGVVFQNSGTARTDANLLSPLYIARFQCGNCIPHKRPAHYLQQLLGDSGKFSAALRLLVRPGAMDHYEDTGRYEVIRMVSHPRRRAARQDRESLGFYSDARSRPWIQAYPCNSRALYTFSTIPPAEAGIHISGRQAWNPKSSTS